MRGWLSVEELWRLRALTGEFRRVIILAWSDYFERYLHPIRDDEGSKYRSLHESNQFLELVLQIRRVEGNGSSPMFQIS